MRSDLTDITVVLDRSGSMSAIKTDAQGGLNQFIKDQSKLPGDANFTLVQFDTVYEFVHNSVPIKEVPECVLLPRGGTALLDAIGRAITETGERLSKMNEEDRPSKVVFVIITDGEENSSQEFTRERVNEMITEQTNKYSWQFVFLAANQDAIKEASKLGISFANAMNFSYTGQGMQNSYTSLNKNLKNYRSGQSLGMSFSQEDRDQAMEED